MNAKLTVTDVPKPPHVHETSNTSVSLEWDSIVGAVKYLVFAESEEAGIIEVESFESHVKKIYYFTKSRIPEGGIAKSRRWHSEVTEVA